MIAEIIQKFSTLTDSLFNVEQSKSSQLLNKILLLMIFMFGIFVWIRFMNFGDIPEDRLDWADITFPRLSVTQEAIRSFRIPLYVSEKKGLKEVTNLFLSIPDQILSPDIILLNFLSIKQFIVFHILIFYSLGFWGLILFKQKFKLSFFAFLFIFFLFNFNGHIVSHISVGHLTWASYFLFSFFFLLIFELFKDQSIGWNWIAKMSFLQLLIFISGGYHQFVWILMFLAIILFINKNNKKAIFLSILFSILVNLFRILPASLLTGKLKLGFMAGFPSTESIIEGIYKTTSIESTLFFDNTKVNVLGWELNFFLGLVGLLYLAYFGFQFFKNNKNYDEFKLIIPSAIFLILSIGNFYKVFLSSGIPFLSGERISSRFIIMTILIFVFTSTIQLQKLLSQNKSTYIKLGLLLLILLIANDLMNHVSGWEIKIISNKFPSEIYYLLSLGYDVNPVYLVLLSSGAIISIIACVYLIYKTWHKNHKKNK